MAKFVINLGHAPNGIPDPGATNKLTGLRESDVNAIVGEKVAYYLRAVGHEVKTIQSDSLSEVVYLANNWPADVFCSIHCNSATSTDARGTEVWAYAVNGVIPNKGGKLAGAIQTQIVNSLGTVDRGVKGATPGINGKYVLTNTEMVACLVEMAFISNPKDEKLLASPDSQDQFARAIARGLTDYLC